MLLKLAKAMRSQNRDDYQQSSHRTQKTVDDLMGADSRQNPPKDIRPVDFAETSSFLAFKLTFVHLFDCPFAPYDNQISVPRPRRE